MLVLRFRAADDKDVEILGSERSAAPDDDDEPDAQHVCTCDRDFTSNIPIW